MALVLVVDDVKTLAEQYAYDLKRVGGYDTLVATGGAEALEAAVFNWAQKRGVDLAELGIDIRRDEQEEGRLVCTCFGLTEPYIERKIEELIAHRLEREQQILSCLGQRKRSVTEIVAEIYPELDRRLVELARMQVLAHLGKLVQEGKATVSGEEYSLK